MQLEHGQLAFKDGCPLVSSSLHINYIINYNFNSAKICAVVQAEQQNAQEL